MQVVKIMVWEEEGAWIGYLQDYPDNGTQGDTLEELKDQLRNLYVGLTSGAIPVARRVEDLIVS